MDTNNLIIRNATHNDAKHIASAFIMGIGEECAEVYCGQNYRSVIEEIAITDGTQYNYHNVLIAVWNDTVAGVCIGYDGGKLHELRAHTLEVIERRSGKIPYVEDETGEGEFYIDTLAVREEFRSKGIGKRLLLAMCKKAFEEGYMRVGLIVDFDNPKAENLYASLGFKRIGEKTFLGHKMWHMQLEKQQ